MRKLTLLFLTISTWVNGQNLEWTQQANPQDLPINTIVFTSDGQKVISGTDCHPASIRIFNVDSGTLVWDYTVGNSFECIMGLTFSSNSTYIAAAEETGNLLIFNNSSGMPVLVDTIQTGTTYGFATAISPDNLQVAMACSNGKLKIYELGTGIELHDINAHLSWVTTVAFSPNGQYLITGGSDDKVKIWDGQGNLLFTCLGHSADVSRVLVTPDNQKVVSVSKDKTIKVWDIQSGNLLKTIEAHSFGITNLAISPDGSKLATSSTDRTCKIWKLETGQLLSSFAEPDSVEYRAIAWSPNGNKIATGNNLSHLSVWNIDLNLTISSKNNPDKFLSLVYKQEAGKLHFLNPDNQTNLTLHITNSIGHKVKEFYPIPAEINLSDLPSGFYLSYVSLNEQVKACYKFYIP